MLTAECQCDISEFKIAVCFILRLTSRSRYRESSRVIIS